MNRSHPFSWLLLFVWGAWASAITGYFVQFGSLGAWTPDLCLALLVALSARASVHDIAKLAICLGVARASVSVDAPAAVLASMLCCGALLRAARSMVQIESWLVAGAFAAALCVGQAAWLEFVHLGTSPELNAGFTDISLALGAGAATGVLTGLLGGLLANLPGLGRLARRKSWVVGASYR